MSVQWIIIEGQEETGGLTYIGPFDNEYDAEKEAVRLFSDTNIRIIEVLEPDEETIEGDDPNGDYYGNIGC